MQISERIKKMEYSSIRKLTPFANEAKEKGKKVYHLNIGAPDVETPEDFFESIRNYQVDTLSYAPSAGLLQLRQAISDYYKDLNLDFSEDEIIITAGASEALLFSLFAICDSGDEIITADPYYSNYNSYLIQTGVKLKTFATHKEDQFAFPTKDEMCSCITDRTRAILVCNPANPTGSVCSKEEIERVVELAEENDLYIIADEIYRDFIYDGREFISFGQYDQIEDRLIILDSISKRFSACGARIGAIMSKNQDLMAGILKLATARLAVPTLEQVGATGLYNMENDYLEKTNKEYSERRDLVYNRLSQIEGVETYKSQGAFYTIASLPVDNADDFAQWLLTDFDHEGETVMLAPASGFYQEEGRGIDEVRIAFAIGQEDLKRALDLLDLAIKEYNDR